jgi:hypothetical protein
VIIASLLGVAIAGSLLGYRCALLSLEAEKTLHTTIFSLRLLECFVSERGRWPRSWSELEAVSMPEGPLGQKWPTASPEVQRRVSIDFEIDPLRMARQDPMSVTAVRPIGPHYEFRDDAALRSLQEAILRSMTSTPRS